MASPVQEAVADIWYRCAGTQLGRKFADVMRKLRGADPTLVLRRGDKRMRLMPFNIFNINDQ